MAADQSVVEPVHSDSWPARWLRIITVSIVAILACYFVGAILAAPFFADSPWSFSLDSFEFPALWGFLIVGLVHWLANILLAFEKDPRPIRWLRFLRECIWFVIVPLIPIFGLAIQLLSLREYFPRMVPDVICQLVVLCPLVTFFQLRKLALQIGQVRLAGLTRIVAIGDVLSLLVMDNMRAWRYLFAGRVMLQSFSGAVAFLLPQVALMFFTLGSLYVLFEMAGHFFNLAWPRQDKRENWIGPQPIRS